MSKQYEKLDGLYKTIWISCLEWCININLDFWICIFQTVSKYKYQRYISSTKSIMFCVPWSIIFPCTTGNYQPRKKIQDKLERFMFNINEGKLRVFLPYDCLCLQKAYKCNFVCSLFQKVNFGCLLPNFLFYFAKTKT